MAFIEQKYHNLHVLASQMWWFLTFVCFISLSIENGPLIEQNKQFQDVSLGSENLWLAFFSIFLHSIDPNPNLEYLKQKTAYSRIKWLQPYLLLTTTLSLIRLGGVSCSSVIEISWQEDTTHLHMLTVIQRQYSHADPVWSNTSYITLT